MSHIRKRRIFFINGFDPKHLRSIEKRLQQSADAITQQEGKNIEFKANPSHKSSFLISNKKQETENVLSFLNWTDIVKDNWTQNPIGLWFNSIKSYFSFVKGFRWHLTNSIPTSSFLCVFVPLLFWIFLLTSILILGAYLTFEVWNLPLFFLAWILLTLIFTQKLLHKIGFTYIFRLLNFNRILIKKDFQFLDERSNKFCVEIKDAISDDTFDEVVVIGYSIGCVWIPRILSQLHQNMPPESLAKFKTLTLGHSLPFYSYHKIEHTFLRDLKELQQKEFNWFDISASDDFAATPGVDPLYPLNGTRSCQSVVFTPSFKEFYTEKNYKKFRFNPFLLHQLYLLTPEKAYPLNLLKLISSNIPLDVNLMQLHLEFKKVGQSIIYKGSN